MPEGDTLRRVANVLGPVLVGSTVVRFSTPVARAARAGRRIEGRTIVQVEAVGKHLLIRFDDGRALRTHLRMAGSWHLYRPGERWKKPERQARVVLETPEAVAVCFNAPEVEVLTGGAARIGGAAGRVGPDLLDEDVDLADVAAAWRSRPELPIGVALMRQHLAAGIGNVYKSEVLFLCRVDPFVPIADLDDRTLAELARVARREMRRNLGPGPRRTRNALDGGRYWVYGRRGERCLKCGAVVQMRRQGEDGRSTYYCGGCQGVGEV